MTNSASLYASPGHDAGRVTGQSAILTLRHDREVGPRSVSAALDALHSHVQTFFDGHRIDVLHYSHGPIARRVPEFHILRAEPGPRFALWTYVTAGVWDATQHQGHGLEFVLAARDDDIVHLEHLAMTAFYHAGPPQQRLDVGHTVPIGQPWVGVSACDHFLVSLPYPYGRDLEICDWEDGHARLLWLLPITKAERDFKASNGLEDLEVRFDKAAIQSWDPTRASVV